MQNKFVRDQVRMNRDLFRSEQDQLTANIRFGRLKTATGATVPCGPLRFATTVSVHESGARLTKVHRTTGEQLAVSLRPNDTIAKYEMD